MNSTSEELSSERNNEHSESTSLIYLRGGKIDKVPSSSAETFLIANEDVMEPRHIKTKEKRRRLDISQQLSLYDSSKEIRELADEAATAVMKRSNQKDDRSWVKTLAADLAKFND
jgi:hypothetical protein